jgi:hypothetical protein
MLPASLGQQGKAAALPISRPATAVAQSISALPPTAPATAPTAAAPGATTPGATTPGAADKIYPNPGNATQWQEQYYQPAQSDNDPARHPYSKPHFGPAPD